MIIEFNNPHALNYGENDSAWIKSKYTPKSKYFIQQGKNVENYRILVKGVNSGDKMLLFLESRKNFFGRPNSYQMSSIEFKSEDFNFISPDHLQNIVLKESDGHDEEHIFDYYKLDSDPSRVDIFFQAWKASDPMLHTGGYTHQFMTKINGYTWSYKFNNKSY
jgi:hypothetical protein